MKMSVGFTAASSAATAGTAGRFGKAPFAAAYTSGTTSVPMMIASALPASGLGPARR